MSNLKVYKVNKNEWTILLQSGEWTLYPNDILFFEDSGEIMKNNAPVFVTCYKLTKIYYDSPEFDPNKSDVERSLDRKFGLTEPRMVWLNDINLNNPHFKHRNGSWYSINDVIECGEKWKNNNPSFLINKLMSELLEDITLSWIRENKLEEIGI